MNINAKISLFRNAFDPEPWSEITIQQFIENVIQCDYVSEIAAIRAETDKSQRDAIKKTLPCFTISGTFTKRGNQHLKQHSGFICIDIDAKGNDITDWPAFRNSISSLNEVLFTALSVSGRGVFLIIPIAYPHKHKEQFLALEKDFLSMGIVIDPICKDVSRLRGISSDVNAVANLNAQPYRKMIIEQPTAPKYNGKASPDLQKLIDWTNSKFGVFAKGNRNNYVTQLAGACHRFGIHQSEVETYCRTLAQSDYTENEIKTTIRSIYSNSLWKAKAILT